MPPAAKEGELTAKVRAADIPAVTVQQMREVDRIMVEDLGIELLEMMENAGRALAGRPAECSAATRPAADGPGPAPVRS